VTGSHAIDCAIFLSANKFVMGSLLALSEGMRTLGLFLTLLAATPQAATDQTPVVPEGTVIASAQVTGFDIERLSPGLREEIRNLANTPLKQETLNALAARIEAERPHHVAAARAVMEPDGQARVFFVVGRREPPDRDDNVNSRYIVEEAHLTGVPDAELTQALRDDLRALIGKRLDSGEADRFQERLERELPRYDVSRRIRRGSEIGRIRLVYEARKKELPAWLRFESLRSNFVYHSEQGAGAYLDVGIGDRNIRFTPIAVIDDADDLVEEYSGYGLRFETRKLGTRRLGASLEWSSFDQDWRTETLGALAFKPEIPGLYEERSTITPLLKFALSPDVSVAAGVSISELEPISPVTDSQMANAVVASLEFNRRWKEASDAAHRVEGSFGVRAGSRSLESDLAYTRYFGQGTYRFDFGRHHVQAAGMAGGITGHPPLFERFTLGDSTTLRGWDKYEIAPAGGDRVIHSSIEYRYTGLALFLDIGSVWDANTERQVRVSTGFGFHGGPAFFVVGFPLNTDNLSAIVMMGLRIPGVGIRW
jgi:Omp85 superfamily domain